MSPRIWTIELPGYDRPPLSLNQRGSSRGAAIAHNNVRRDLMGTVRVLAYNAKLPTGLDRARIELHWQPSVRRSRDTDNPDPTLKACIDALTRGSRSFVGYGLTADDDSAHVESGVVIEPVAKPARMWLSIRDLGSE